MNIVLIMTDKDTGEILWQTSRQFSCNFVKGDAGRALIGRMVDSAIKGVRMSEQLINLCSDIRTPLIALSTIRPIKARPASPLTKLQAS